MEWPQISPNWRHDRRPDFQSFFGRIKAPFQRRFYHSYRGFCAVQTRSLATRQSSLIVECTATAVFHYIELSKFGLRQPYFCASRATENVHNCGESQKWTSELWCLSKQISSDARKMCKSIVPRTITTTENRKGRQARTIV